MDYVFIVQRNSSFIAAAHSEEKGVQIVEDILLKEQANGDQLIQRSEWRGTDKKRLSTTWMSEDDFTFSAIYEVEKEIIQ